MKSRAKPVFLATVSCAMSLLVAAAAQMIISEENSPRIDRLPNGNSVLRETHSDGGSLIPGRSWGMDL